MTDFGALLRRLVESRVEFILVGGVAATVHGSARLTQDLDVVYRRNQANLVRLAGALDDLNPYLRGVPPGLPFLWSPLTLERGLNFTLTCAWGDVDLLGEITGGGGYEELSPHTIPIAAFGVECLCLDLTTLIQVKRAAGRPKDLETVAELEAIEEESQSNDD